MGSSGPIMILEEIKASDDSVLISISIPIFLNIHSIVTLFRYIFIYKDDS